MAVNYDIRFAISGDTILQRHIATAQTAISDFSPLWADIEKRFIQMETSQFATEGRGRWPQLSAATVAKRGGAAHPILYVTGALFRSLTGGAGFYVNRSPLSIVIGTALQTPKGNWNLGLLHQLGTERTVRSTSKSGKALKHPKVSFRMPPRPPIDPSWQERIELRTVFAAYIHKAVTGEEGPTN